MRFNTIISDSGVFFLFFFNIFLFLVKPRNLMFSKIWILTFSDSSESTRKFPNWKIHCSCFLHLLDFHFWVFEFTKRSYLDMKERIFCFYLPVISFMEGLLNEPKKINDFPKIFFVFLLIIQLKFHFLFDFQLLGLQIRPSSSNFVFWFGL